MLGRLLPNKLRQALTHKRETAALAALSRLSCNTSNLRREAVPLDGSYEAEWAQVQAAVAPLKVGDTTAAVNPGDRRAIYELVRRLGARRVLEVGTHIGGSTVMIALALKKNGSDQLTSVDIRDVNAPDAPWKVLGLQHSPREATRLVGCDFVRFVTMPSLQFLRGTPERFDLIFLDGGHEAATVYQEVPAALPLLNPGGVILLHDFYPEGSPLWDDGVVVHGPWEALQRLRTEGASLQATPLGALPWPTKRGSNVTSLALVTAQ